LGGDGNVDIKGDYLGVGAHPDEGRHFVGGVDGGSPQIFDVVEEDDLLLVVRDKDKDVVLVEVHHLGASVNFATLRLPIAFAAVNP
jgi:hypothetical protein